MEKSLKQFIEDNIELIEENNFEKLYGKIGSSLTSPLTKVLMSIDINPLLYIKSVPSCYCFENEELTKIDIPQTVDYIGAEAFAECTNLIEVTLPDGINTIDFYSFVGCSKLEKINFPSSLETILECSFSDCGFKELTLPDIKTIPKGCFERCVDLKEATLSPNNQTLGSYVFSGCRNLNKVNINEGLRSINSHVFRGCFDLTEIYIPNSVDYISSKAFPAELKSILEIHCHAGSTAEKFAQDNGYKVKLI